MAYATSNPPKLVVPRMGDGPGVWIYSDDDAHTDVDADDYFTDGDDLGMRLGDALLYHDVDTATSTIHFVRAQVTAPAASVTIATLS